MKNARMAIQQAAAEGIRFLPLLKYLIARDLKKKYRTTVLGYAWCILNPLLVMVIMTVVFSSMFRSNISNYPVYLFCGRMMYSFVTGGAGNVMRSIRANGGLMRKTRIPYSIFPVSSFCSAFVDLLFTLVAFALVLLLTRTPVSIHVVAFPLVVLEASLFTFGLGLLLAICDVFVQDTAYLYSVFTVAWMYLTPIFYPLESLPAPVQHLISTYNPLYDYIAQARAIFLNNAWPSEAQLLWGFGVGLGVFILSLLAYNKAKQNLMLYV